MSERINSHSIDADAQHMLELWQGSKQVSPDTETSIGSNLQETVVGVRKFVSEGRKIIAVDLGAKKLPSGIDTIFSSGATGIGFAMKGRPKRGALRREFR